MKKIKLGIITHYYKNNNYGGVLQAYALCKKLKDLGVDAYQISYRMCDKNIAYRSICIKTLVYCRRIIRECFNYVPHFSAQLKIKKRLHKINNFRNSIPHTKKTYDLKSVSRCNDFDAYIVGSDQVWNPAWIDDAFLLNFIHQKRKFSYAASIGVDKLDSADREKFQLALKDYSSISVREEEAVELLTQLTEKNVELVLDPTLLLTGEEWSKLCERRCPQEEYVFCYFLGEQENQRKLAEAFAKEKGCQLLSVPYLGGRYRKVDKNFNSVKIYDVSPGRFISLIKNAKYVFTDSFHASVFSHIFHKDFFVFLPGEIKSTGCRLYTLTDMFATRERVCDTVEKKNICYLLSLPPIDYNNKDFSKYNELKNASIDFLKKNIQHID